MRARCSSSSVFCSGAVLAIGLVALAPTLARAADCGAAGGKTIFEDNFKDTTGGWDDDKQAVFGHPGLSLTLGKTESSWNYVNAGFDAHDANYCLEAVVPTAVAKGNDAAVGLEFLRSDDKHFYKLQIYSDQTIQLLRFNGDDVSTLYGAINSAVQAPPGSVVALRVIVKDGLLTASVNGVEIKKTRAKLPDGSARFGVAVRTDKVSGQEVSFQLNRLIVSELPSS